MSLGGTGRTLALTAAALIAFAANSLLCRLALVAPSIEPAAFTTVRLCSGALVLLPFLRGPRTAEVPWSPVAAAALFVYALAFSLAYVTLDAGVGALLLFGSVQVTMFAAGLLRGERLGPWQLVGLVAAIAGFLVQVLPGLTAPDPLGAVLMSAAGVAWGLYSLKGQGLGRGAALPRTATARNFLLTVPAALLLVSFAGAGEWEPRGLGLAVASGALTSGLGYVLWYAALSGHTATSAALVQLSVPVLAAAGGMLLLAEDLTPRFAVAAALTLGGIALATARRRRA